MESVGGRILLRSRDSGEEIEHPWAGGSEQPEEDRQGLVWGEFCCSQRRVPASGWMQGGLAEDLTSKGAKDLAGLSMSLGTGEVIKVF